MKKRDHEIVLCRHGETQLNIEDRLRGRADAPLSAHGTRQAEALAASFDPWPPSVVVASPRRRALETAVTIARRQRVAVSVDERLDDLDYGAWTGLRVDEVRAEWPELYERYLNDPANVQFPGGEAIAAAQARAWSIVSEIAAIDRHVQIALVTHDAVIRLLLCHLLRAPLTRMHQMVIGLASTTGLVVHEHEPQIAWIAAQASDP